MSQKAKGNQLILHIQVHLEAATTIRHYVTFVPTGMVDFSS